MSKRVKNRFKKTKATGVAVAFFMRNVAETTGSNATREGSTAGSGLSGGKHRAATSG
jgi:hypothetical protein